MKNKGNKNAQKAEVPASAYIQVRCTPDQKQKWIALASKIGVTLSDLIKSKLENQND